jgi:hypothetical protein
MFLASETVLVTADPLAGRGNVAAILPATAVVINLRRLVSMEISVTII